MWQSWFVKLGQSGEEEELMSCSHRHRTLQEICLHPVFDGIGRGGGIPNGGRANGNSVTMDNALIIRFQSSQLGDFGRLGGCKDGTGSHQTGGPTLSCPPSSRSGSMPGPVTLCGWAVQTPTRDPHWSVELQGTHCSCEATVLPVYSCRRRKAPSECWGR